MAVMHKYFWPMDTKHILKVTTMGQINAINEFYH